MQTTIETNWTMKKADLGRIVLPNATIRRMRKIAALEHLTGAEFVRNAIEKEIERAARRIPRKEAGRSLNSLE